MKLIKIKNTDKGVESFSFIIDGLNIKLDFSDEIYTRTTRIVELKKALSVLNPSDIETVFLMTKKLILFPNEEIIYEIEFEKVEDLIELIPEEFL